MAFLWSVFYLGKYSKPEKRRESIWKEGGRWMKLPGVQLTSPVAVGPSNESTHTYGKATQHENQDCPVVRTQVPASRTPGFRCCLSAGALSLGLLHCTIGVGGVRGQNEVMNISAQPRARHWGAHLSKQSLLLVFTKGLLCPLSKTSQQFMRLLLSSSPFNR